MPSPARRSTAWIRARRVTAALRRETGKPPERRRSEVTPIAARRTASYSVSSRIDGNRSTGNREVGCGCGRTAHLSVIRHRGNARAARAVTKLAAISLVVDVSLPRRNPRAPAPWTLSPLQQRPARNLRPSTHLRDSRDPFGIGHLRQNTVPELRTNKHQLGRKLPIRHRSHLLPHRHGASLDDSL